MGWSPVPEGQNDRSQAIYCLEQVQPRIRPVGHGLILAPGWSIVLIVTRLSDPIIPYPTGRFPFSHGYQAINCLATIGKSLRDNRLTAVHEIGATSSFFQRLWSPTIRSLDQKQPFRPNRIPKSRTRTITTTLNTPIYAILHYANSCFPRFRLLFDRRLEASSRRFGRTRWDIIHFNRNHNFFFSRPRKWADPPITARFFGDGQSCRCD